MRRTLLLTMDFPPMRGGVAAYWANLVRYFPCDDLVVLAPEYDNSLDFDIKQNYLIYRRNILSKKEWLWPKWLPFFFHAWRLARREKIKYIIVGQVLPGGTIAMLLKRLLKIPYAVSFHGLDIALAQNSSRKRALLERIIRHADRLIVNSKFTCREVEKLAVAQKKPIKVVYPCPNTRKGIIDEALYQKTLKEYHLKGKKVLLSVGRLIERKGHDKVLQALPSVIKTVPDVMLLIVGRGAYLHELENLARKYRVEHYVQFLQEVMNDELSCLYHACDVFVMSSRQLANGDVEGFGIVYLEANTFGKPVIAGASGGAVEAVKHMVNGLLVQPTNTNELAQAMISLLTNKQKAEILGAQGAKRVEEKFSWQVQANRLIEFLS